MPAMDSVLPAASVLAPLLEAMGEGVVIVDADGLPVHWNAAAGQLFGPMLPGRSGLAEAPGMIPLSRIDRPLGRALLGAAVTDEELLLQRPGGGVILLSTTARPLRNAQGRIVGALSTYRDVTARCRTEVSLRESERIYRHVVRHLPSSAVLLFDRSLRFLLADGEALAAAGVKGEELVGKGVEELGGAALLPQYRAVLEGVASDHVAECLGGLYRLQLTPVREDDGTIYGGLLVAQDVTREKRAEKAMREAKEELALTFDHAPNGMALVSLDRRWLRVNPRLCAMLGYTAEELLACTFCDVTHPDDVAPSRVLAERLVRGELPRYQFEKRYLRKDGSVVEALLHVGLVRDEQGAGSHFVVLIEDLTERRRLEARLRLADRMVSLGTLSAGIAHEVNNPLGYVMANLGLLVEQLAAPGPLGGGVPAAVLHELRELADEALEGAERVRRIIRGVKAFSRVDEERRTSQPLAPILDLAETLTATEVRHAARLVKDYGPAPLVNVDETRLVQVFVNLLANAAQAIEAGDAGAHEIRVRTFTDACGRAVVEVEDTGPGIRPEDLRRVFDPFFTTKAVGSGTGLGLSISHGIVTGLGGEISVESTPGRGALFRVVLPPATVPVAARVAPRPAAARLRRGRVLIVDDDVRVARGLSRLLSAEHDVAVVGSGAAALARILGGEPLDVVLCDLMMPDMTGMDVHAAVLARAPALARRLVFITGGAFTPAARAFLDDVPNLRLEKPVVTEQLRDVVRGFVEEG
jgi:PAS domain S-box-containing protein